MVNFANCRFKTDFMSFSFRLRYFIGLIPKAQKIDAAWAELLSMRDELQSIEGSKELARYNELKQLVQSVEFQTKKIKIVNLAFKGSSENITLAELANLEKSKPVKDYFKFAGSPAFKRVADVANSSELARFLELKKIVESADFVRRKKETEALRYKGSPEFIKRQEYNALQKNAKLKLYYTTKESAAYRGFLELEAMGETALDNLAGLKDPRAKHYRNFRKSKAYKNILSVEELGLPGKSEQLRLITSTRSFIENEAFLKNRARYQTTLDYTLLNEFSRLSKSSDIQFYLKCIDSSLYKNYQKFDGSKELVRLQELRKKCSSDTFVKRVAYLKNKKRYETSPEFTLESELISLEKSKLITTYHKLRNRSELAFFDQWEIVLDEQFPDQQLSTKLWEPENYWGSKMLGSSFSQANELQAYKGMNNIELKNRVLSIVTKAEKTDGKVWNPSFGLIPKKFDFSSGILNTGNGFRFKEGVVEAKVRFRACKGITSSFSLTGNKPFPQIDVFRSGINSVGLGIIHQSGNGGIKDFAQIKGLNFNNFHIFRIEISGKQAVWKINNHEVHRQHITRHDGDWFLNFTGSIHQESAGRWLPHHFEIDWVRCLRKKS